MNTPQEHQGEHRRGEGLGGRVRRFVDTELSRVLDKEDRGARTRTDPPASPDPAGRDDVVDRGYNSPPAHETPAHETPVVRETPAHETPVVRETPAHETPVVRETPAHETPVRETPAYESRRAHDPDPGVYSEPADSYLGRSGTADSPATTAPHDAGRDTSAARVGLLNDVGGLRDEWQQVQSTFVDDPQRAVQEASALVERTLEEIRANVGSKRSTETMSTEDLRVSFQRYREFFQRLLAA